MDIEELLQRAQLLVDQESFNEAADLIVQVLQLDADNIRALFISAIVLLKTQRLDSAKLVYKRIIELNPNNAFAMLSLGFVYEQMNDIPAAKTWWGLAVNCECDENVCELAIRKLESYSDA